MTGCGAWRPPKRQAIGGVPAGRTRGRRDTP